MHRRARWSRFVVPVFLTAFGGAWLPCAAQARGGDIRGVVVSAESRAPIAGARVGVSTPARAAVADPNGVFVLRDLPAGRYEVLVTALGRTPARDTVTVTAGRTTTHDVALGRGSLMLSSVIVSATRTPTTASQVASTVNVLGPEQIAQSPARETQDMLREMPGVELPRTSSLVGGTAQIVSIRGVDEGRTAVLFDGIPINDAWGEWIDWGRAPKGMIERVEVVEGGTSHLYGNGAIGGTISFFSRPLAPGAFNALVEGGSRGTRHGFVSAGVPLVGALSANVSGDYQEGGGYTLLDPAKRGPLDRPSEIIQRNAYLRLTFAPSAHWSAFATGHLFGDARQTGTPLSYQSRDQKHVDAGFDHDAVAGGSLSLRGWDGAQDEFNRSSSIRGGRAAEDSSVVANIPSHDWGTSALWTRGGIPWMESVSVGADYRHYNGNYDERDYNTSCPGASCGSFLRSILSGGDQALSGAFVQAIAAPLAPLRVEVALRVDHWDNANGRTADASGTVEYPDSSKSRFSPRIGLRYQALPSLSFHGAYYEAFRAPNLAELYRKQINANASQITLPNPYLGAESARGREVGLDWQPAAWMQVKGTWYVADYEGFNSPVTLTGASRPAACGTATTCRQRLNVNRSRSKGGEAYLALRPVPALFVSASVNYDDARVVEGPAGTVAGAPINRVPSPRQTIRATYTVPTVGDLTAMWRHEGQTTTLQGLPLEPFTVVDASLRHEILPGLRGLVAMENIGNVQYQVNVAGTGAAALYSYGMPRTLRVGIEAYRY
ncbi:MAG: TonB-dependent receptor [Gemmatimonadetes bacterium]|nr:TonB-dependent receptor [Gemmatimonadota bacterium]